MKIHSILKRGELHKTFCEDFLFTQTIHDRYFVGAIFDGCSGGKDSHFASTLSAKILQKIVRNMDFKNEPADIYVMGKQILFSYVKEMQNCKNQLQLSTDEMLATCLFLITDDQNSCAHVWVCGDGLISINGSITEINQNNKPDYPAYYLDEIVNQERFDQWIDFNVKHFNISNFVDLTIASDGILTFVRDTTFHPDNQTSITFDPIRYLCEDKFLENNQAMFARKCNLLRTKYGLINNDDLSIIRIMK
jgi:hypothetical protein